ncbi:hypothetical protein WDU94_010792 [Cyamophila willieti]
MQTLNWLSKEKAGLAVDTASLPVFKTLPTIVEETKHTEQDALELAVDTASLSEFKTLPTIVEETKHKEQDALELAVDTASLSEFKTLPTIVEETEHKEQDALELAVDTASLSEFKTLPTIVEETEHKEQDALELAVDTASLPEFKTLPTISIFVNIMKKKNINDKIFLYFGAVFIRVGQCNQQQTKAYQTSHFANAPPCPPLYAPTSPTASNEGPNLYTLFAVTRNNVKTVAYEEYARTKESVLSQPTGQAELASGPPKTHTAEPYTGGRKPCTTAMHGVPGRIFGTTSVGQPHILFLLFRVGRRAPPHGNKTGTVPKEVPAKVGVPSDTQETTPAQVAGADDSPDSPSVDLDAGGVKGPQIPSSKLNALSAAAGTLWESSSKTSGSVNVVSAQSANSEIEMSVEEDDATRKRKRARDDDPKDQRAKLVTLPQTMAPQDVDRFGKMESNLATL